ncbi:uncharacterized protein MYCGRDRAFT_106918 [Zymoseptoria tritici IPO323]|uniref:Uncharacterized protein n=3 Tax=Zymoseptoria tritici TaxID=1047171 RepID=F9WYV3_ZYMTI|nr:uncharacterized protein MYCGRDRAFT_106918 [Zymoseptoria tritici IPO323]EGP92606.1 hypothetical protein MYCGRDRAFT_106918 [Zymoseptoria tritici IPO323]
MLLDHLTDAAAFEMSSRSFFTPSPTVVMPAAPPQQYFASTHHPGQNSIGSAFTTNGNTPSTNGFTNPFTSNATTPGSIAGRKRSRGDIFDDDEDSGPHADGSIATPNADEIAKPRGKPVYGPGMTLIYPEDPGYAAAAESQSGTWVEEDAERQPFKLASIKRPSVTSRKSQRMDSRATLPGADDLAQLVLPAQMREVTTEPLIDETTRSLGISWTRMDRSEALQINQRAYSKWIQNHYPRLTDVSIWFENSAMPAYLVAAKNAYNGQHEYYIFANDLTEAQLVTTDPSQLIPRLKMLPALHLAAPGGLIKAETDPITAAQNENNIQTGLAVSYEEQPAGGCAAHAMELD